MIYADFNYYQLTYYGNQITDPDVYNRLATRAASEIDYYTMGRAAGSELEAVKMCACAVADCVQAIETASRRASSDSGELASESVGSYSRSYRSAAEVTASAKAEIRGVIEKYLAHTGLLYRGVSVCTHRIP